MSHPFIHDFNSAQHFLDHASVCFEGDHLKVPSPEKLLEFVKKVWSDLRDFTIALCRALKADIDELFALDAALTSETATATDICALWSKAKPIVSLIVNFPFFPARWKAPVTALINLLNAFCPAQ